MTRILGALSKYGRQTRSRTASQMSGRVASRNPLKQGMRRIGVKKRGG